MELLLFWEFRHGHGAGSSYLLGGSHSIFSVLCSSGFVYDNWMDWFGAEKGQINNLKYPFHCCPVLTGDFIYSRAVAG